MAPTAAHILSSALLLSAAAAVPFGTSPTTTIPTTVAPTPSPATTPPATTNSYNSGGGDIVIRPHYYYGSTVVDGTTYPVYGGAIDGGYSFTQSGASVTGAAGGSLQNCYYRANGKVMPALCYSGFELDTEVVEVGGHTFYDGGPMTTGQTADVVGTGQFPGPQSFSAGGVVGEPGKAIAGGAVSGYYTPALDSTTGTFVAGINPAGAATLGFASAKGNIGGTVLTAPHTTSYAGGAAGTGYLGPLEGEGTLGGFGNGPQNTGCAGLGAEGIGYTACFPAPGAKRTAEPEAAEAQME